MNAAARSQGAAARQSVTDAWRGQLRSLRDRADSFWFDRAAAIDSAATGATVSEAQAFRRIVQQGLADSVVLSRYPLPARETFPTVPARPDWQTASELEHTPGRLRDAADHYSRIAIFERDPELANRAAQAQIRCLARSGDKEAALRAIQRYFVAGKFDRSRSLTVATDEFLFAVKLLKPNDPRYHPAVERPGKSFERLYGSRNAFRTAPLPDG